MERESSQKVLAGVVAGAAVAATASLVRSLSRSKSGDMKKSAVEAEKDVLATDSIIGSTLGDEEESTVAVEDVLPLQAVEFEVLSVQNVDDESQLFVVGGCEELGSWNPELAVKLERGARRGTFVCQIQMHCDFHGVIEFKFLKRSLAGETAWEQGENRAFAVQGEGCHVENDVTF
ncbi:hypothetical protein FVE85_1637 [Porphyridium purpureum]|uniref:CBM20 domain-containing protein n=1 Tax=Porphyridium purpureum TaxID=35688 RepID=A0A5J4YX86_PORPP|nr:hypothetical protein FVE85_1637 [Porphyridium purpureum]|eukprot:POR9576..scf209_3